ncbi:Transcription-repair-coupling factor [compost metagenome]
MAKLDDCIRRQALPKGLLQPLEKSLQRGAQLFLFVSRIRHIEPAVQLLRRYFSNISIEGTSSKDERRGDKVIQFRSTEIRILVTTTILERGVTVPKSDVYILDADSELFDEASLVQMAGRAGRSKDDPCGTVWLASPEWTKSQRKAIAQIRSMNKVAEQNGYLKRPYSKSSRQEVPRT